MNSIKERWMNAWGGFEKKHPKLAKWVYQIFYFFVFSMGVTIFQYLVFKACCRAIIRTGASQIGIFQQVCTEVAGIVLIPSVVIRHVVSRGQIDMSVL